jgi:hypothetical protein
MRRREFRVSLLVPAFLATALLLISIAPAVASTRVASRQPYSPVQMVSVALPADLPMNCPAPADPNAVQLMIDVDSAFGHQAANWNSAVMGRLLKWQCFDAIGRNKNAEWILARNTNGQVWLHGSTFRFRGDLMSLPLTENVVIRTSVSAGALPKGLPVVSYRARGIYQSAARNGLDPAIFTVIGDCNAESAVYLGRFAAGGFDYSAYPTLKQTVVRFTPSFTRTSLATHGSFNAAMAFDSTWADPKQCQGDEGPLACELRVSKASILVIALGTGDQHDWQSFEANYRQIVDFTLKQGVLPVLMTKADALESQEGGAPVETINNVIRRVGREYGVPVIDFWLATRSLPNNGLADESSAQAQNTNPFHLNEQGMDMRMLMTLFTLKSISGR